MSGYGFLSSLRVFFAIGGIVLVGVFTLAFSVYSRLERLAQYRHRFGQNWTIEYEQDFEAVATTQTKIVVSVVGIVVIISLVVWLCRIIGRNNHASNAGRSRTKRSSDRFGSSLERNISYRRKGVVRIYFGLAGIVSAVVLVILPLGIFSDHSNQESLGLGVFVCGYLGVIAGCSSWLKAKALSEGIVFIGFMPLVILLIPFVRLIFLAAPLLLPASMVMMPIVLIVVVFVLPDKSGTSTKKFW